MNATDFLELEKLKIAKTLKASLPGNVSKALNVLTVKDNVLFTWDFRSQCLVTVNLKAAQENEDVIVQNLLPVSNPIFSPEKMKCNESGTLLIVAGRNGILVFELPPKCPPYGCFNNNKELVFCKTYSIEERLLLCGNVELLQVKFHPGSVKDNHVLVLTSDNTLRLYQIDDKVMCLGTYLVGDKPIANLPNSKMTFLGALGEIAVDFAFGHPELNSNNDVLGFDMSITKSHIKVEDSNRKLKVGDRDNYTNFKWPIYILSADFVVTVIDIPIYEKLDKPTLVGNMKMNPANIFECNKRACSIVCLNSTPQVVCIASTNGEILQGVILPSEKLLSEQSRFTKEIFVFEIVEIELGLATSLSTNEEPYTCPVFLHEDDSRCDKYFATHSTGVHMVTIECMEDLQESETTENIADIFKNASTAEYLLCTKTTTNKSFNPVVGFSVYYNPYSIIIYLANGNLLSLPLITTGALPKIDRLKIGDEVNVDTPLKQLLKTPFDQYIQNLLKKSESHPILKLPKNEQGSLKECQELLHNAAQIFQNKLKCHVQAKEEIEKRATSIGFLKDYQLKLLDDMKNQKSTLQEKAEALAEKYEDIREKQEVLLKRCAKLLIKFSMNKDVISDAEKQYLIQLKDMREKLNKYDTNIEKLISKKNYQERQMRTWNSNAEKKGNISETHLTTIRNNLTDTSCQISDMIHDIKEYKKKLGLE